VPIKEYDVSTAQVYLKPNVLAEPLFNQWYAWPYLLSPATASMYLANLHLNIMRSFVTNPQVHIAALKNPAMLGGPFINYDVSRVDEIGALLEKTTSEQRHLLQLAESIKQLDTILMNEANGYSLEPIYEKVPEALKGYIELTYDLSNTPAVRFIEGLLYKSPYYVEACQSLSLSLIDKDDRSFVFSTPRLADGKCLHLNLPFRHAAYDELFKMKSASRSPAYIKDVLGVEDKDDHLFSTFFTTDAGEKPARYSGDEVRIRYFGHACVLIESAETSVLIDPLISYTSASGISRYTYADLPETIDYVLITHNHQDHCLLETLLQLRHKIKNILVPRNNGGGLADPSLKWVLRSIGFEQVREIDEMEVIDCEGGSICGLPFLGEHADLNIRTKLAYLVSLREKAILFAADSNNIEPRLYDNISRVIDQVDVIFLGMECDGAPLSWLYGPLLSRPLARKMDQSRRFNGSDYDRGIGIVDRLKPKHVYVYAMGQEPWLTYLTSIQYTEQSRPIVESNKLIEECRNRGIIAARLFGKQTIHLEAARPS
jgi:L-ascorbate metabolism protein UlaG (beta-lactamase superfamily)